MKRAEAKKKAKEDKDMRSIAGARSFLTDGLHLTILI